MFILCLRLTLTIIQALKYLVTDKLTFFLQKALCFHSNTNGKNNVVLRFDI